jgi:hypothetical protein
MTQLRVNYDRDLWLHVPEEFPWHEFGTLDEWVSRVTNLVSDDQAFEGPEKEWLANSLRYIHGGRAPYESRYVYLADPRNAFFFVSVLVADPAENLSLDTLAAAKDPAATAAPDVTPFASPTLGDGIRTIRHVNAGPPTHDVVGIVQYAWKGDIVDVVVVASHYNVVLLQEALPVIDELARVIDVVR